MTIYSFRVVARTILDEVLVFRLDFIELQLAYIVWGPNERAHNRTAFLTERRRMMQERADYLDWLKAGEEIDANATASEASETPIYSNNAEWCLP